MSLHSRKNKPVDKTVTLSMTPQTDRGIFMATRSYELSRIVQDLFSIQNEAKETTIRLALENIRQRISETQKAIETFEGTDKPKSFTMAVDWANPQWEVTTKKTKKKRSKR